jgi:pseudouridine-5'-monophosphatase
MKRAVADVATQSSDDSRLTALEANVRDLEEKLQSSLSRSYIRCVIFDLDGTLLDSETWLSEVIDRVLHSRFGVRWTKTDHSAVVVGNHSFHKKIFEHKGIVGVSEEEKEEILHERRRIQHDARFDINPMPGADQLVRRLHLAGVPLAIATSSHRFQVEWKKQAAPALFAKMELVIAADDELMRDKRRKPAPDQYLLAAAILGVPAYSCLVFEDSPQGAQAALDAGMHVVAVRSDFVNDDQFPSGVQLASSLLDFNPRQWAGLRHVE